MPSYSDIDPKTEEGVRTLGKLLALRNKLDKEIPQRNMDDTLILATWNIREFDSPTFRERMPESFHYIAEIINRFDLVAIQEIRKDLGALKKLKALLGDNWNYIVTDVTEGSQGNKERIAFMFDTRKVTFGGLAGELVLPAMRTRDDNGKTMYEPVSQLARTPFLAGFQSGWTSFMLATVHILYGKSKAEDPRRVKEIEYIAQFLRDRTIDPSVWSRNLILLGDFNIFHPKDKTFKALTDAGFHIPPELQNLPSNVSRNKYYDQIAFRIREKLFETTGKAGVFNFFDVVFKASEQKKYVDMMGDKYHITSRGKKRSTTGKKRYYKMWTTYQMSDHLPMWVELKINFTNAYLNKKLESGKKMELDDQVQYSRSTGGGMKWNIGVGNVNKSSGNKLAHSITFDPDKQENALVIGEGKDQQFVSLDGDDYSGTSFAKAQMSGMDLRNKDLSRADFTEANLAEANFAEGRLVQIKAKLADFRHADLSYTDCGGGDFEGAKFAGASVIETNFEGANLRNADFTDAVLFDPIFDDADMEGAIINEQYMDMLGESDVETDGINFIP